MTDSRVIQFVSRLAEANRERESSDTRHGSATPTHQMFLVFELPNLLFEAMVVVTSVYLSV